MARMSEAVTHAVEAPGSAVAPSSQKKFINPKYFSYLYIAVGVLVIVFGNAALANTSKYYPTFNSSDAGVLSVFGLLFIVLGYLDYRNVKSGANKPYLAAILFVLGVIFMLLFVNQYDAPPFAPLEIIPIQTKTSAFYIGNYVVRDQLEGMSNLGILVWLAAIVEIVAFRMRK